MFNLFTTEFLFSFLLFLGIALVIGMLLGRWYLNFINRNKEKVELADQQNQNLNLILIKLDRIITLLQEAKKNI